jgi:hypothetical protein
MRHSTKSLREGRRHGRISARAVGTEKIMMASCGPSSEDRGVANLTQESSDADILLPIQRATTGSSSPFRRLLYLQVFLQK